MPLWDIIITFFAYGYLLYFLNCLSLQKFQRMDVMIRAKMLNEIHQTSYRVMVVNIFFTMTPHLLIPHYSAASFLDHTSFAFFPHYHTLTSCTCCVSSSRRVLHLMALQPVRGPCCLPPVCGWQRALREHHGPGPGHHGLEKHPEGLLHTWRHHRHGPSAAGPRHVRGECSWEHCARLCVWTML